MNAPAHPPPHAIPEPSPEAQLGEIQKQMTVSTSTKGDILLREELRVNSRKFILSLSAARLDFLRPSTSSATFKGIHDPCACYYVADASQVVFKVDICDVLQVHKGEEYFSNEKNYTRVDEFIIHCFCEKEPAKRVYQILRVQGNSEASAHKWVQQFRALLRPSSLPPALPTKKLKVFVNPFSGSQDARKAWQDVAYVFKIAGITIDLTETAYSGQAKEISTQLDLTEFHGIVTVSGDGLLHEVVNGLMERPDWRSAIRMPVGVIAAGSGNGLAKSLNALEPLTAAFNVARGITRSCDLLSVRQAASHRYCFLSVSWGLVSEIDLRSETYRWMGPMRLTVAAVGEVIAPTSFKGRVRYLPADAASSAVSLPSDTSLVEHISSPVPAAASAAASEPLRDTAIEDWARMSDANGWRTIEADFGMVIASNVSHISYNAHVAPRALFDDGCVDLLVIRGIDRGTLLSFLLGLEDGSHTKLEGLEYYKARAFAIEPLTPAGCFSLDGEWTEYTPVRCQVHKGLLTLFC